MELPDIDSLGELRGKRILVRAPLNVPVSHGKVKNDFRLLRFLPTLALLRERGAKIVVMGHIGRESEDSLKPVHAYLNEKHPMHFSPEVIGNEAKEAIAQLKEGETILLENTRAHAGERANDPVFVRELAELGDCYVNDAFSASHRNHASIIGVPAHLPSAAGPNFLDEIESLAPAFEPPEPSLFILGGAKFETKQPLIEKFLNIYGKVFVGGALANDFFKARGFEVGRSLVSDEVLDLGNLLNHPKLFLPIDVVAQNERGIRPTIPEEVTADELILDAGPRTLEKIAHEVRAARFVLWNGPLGNYEEGFTEQTEALVHILAESDAQTIIGGGDTVASIARLNLYEKFGFVSTGGGAMLQFLLEGTLPGIEALTRPHASVL